MVGDKYSLRLLCHHCSIPYSDLVVEMRNTPTQERSRQTLDAIMRAADALFARKGVDGATNTEIAEEAGCSIGSLYRFFPDKEALVAEYVNRYLVALAENLKPLPEVITDDELDRVVSDMVERSIITRSSFAGYDHVRLWRYADGTSANDVVRDSEVALVLSLFESSTFNLPADVAERMTIVIVDGTWPLIASLPSASTRERVAMSDEITFSISSYIRARAAEFAD